MDELKLGATLAAHRAARGLSQEALAEALGTTRQTVSKWELDQALPTLPKLLLLSRLYHTTVDALLTSTVQPHIRGSILRGRHTERCETGKYCLILCEEENGNRLAMRLFAKNEDRARCIAACIHTKRDGVTRYAYLAGNRTIQSDSTADTLLRIPLPTVTEPTEVLTAFDVFDADKVPHPHPTVSESGIAHCLTLWRAVSVCTATPEAFFFSLCAGDTEYIFSIDPGHKSIYCGASFNYPIALGMMAGGQYFRIRAYEDNTAPFCGFHADFSYLAQKPAIPFDTLVLGACREDIRPLVWTVKRYHDDEIVLAGCGGDEYTYRRNPPCDEYLVKQ